MIMGLRTTALVMAAAANTVAVNLKCPCDLRTATNGRTTPSTARSSSTVAFVATGSRTLNPSGGGASKSSTAEMDEQETTMIPRPV
jgi:hypothetical protein